MTTADVTFVIDANDSALVQAARRSVRSLREIEGAFDDLRKSARAGDNEVRRFAAGVDDVDLGPAEQSAKKFTLTADNLGKTLSFLSPRLGEVSAKAASLGMAGGPMLAAAAGMLAVVGAGVALGRMALDTAQNIDELAASLSEADRMAVQASIKSLEEQKVRLDDAADGWTQLKIVVSAAVGGPLTDYLYIAGNIAEATAEASDETDTWLADLVTLPARLATPLFVLEKYADLLGMVADAQREAEGSKFESEFDAQAGRGFDFAGDNGGTFGVGPTVGDLTFDFAKDAEERRKEAARRAKEADDKAFAEFEAQWDARFKFEQDAEAERFALFSENWDAQVAYAEKSQAAIIEAGRQSVIKQAEEQEYLRSVEQARLDARLEKEKQVSAAVEDLTIGLGSLAIDTLASTLAAQAKTAREQWEIQQAAALATALINIPLSILSGLAQGGPALAAVNGILAGAQFAAIAATRPPQVHIGGFAPDEKHTGGMVLRDNERTAVVTAAGQEYLTPNMLAAINAGRNPEPPQVWLVVDGVAQRGRRFATNPATGYANVGARRG